MLEKIVEFFRNLLPQRGAKRIRKEEMQKKLDEMKERVRLDQQKKGK